MRAILFRGKRVDNGEWKFGDLLYLPHGAVIWADGHAKNVDHKTVGQYTGLIDKNGRGIFEGDIVLKSDTNPLGWCRERTCKVSFANTGYWTLITEYGDGCWIGECEMEQIEVIGNIHDNPELLEVGE